ncbi:DUF1704 domain-containing protein [Marivirga sp. S37H4]|uniref:DUF1704 domain-containing protein n=1 Tax=Marivirga aurantiaca TaxID=2802615 RepID=A0A934WW49_9BACT|nr:tyrosine/phenylalanine carboxypeptidase domain-containing protein [Marivirga aurantiaca]MBK6264064.1 DUF1704 domain-containing protein [Marivirga aurantiaca]
MKEGIYQSLIQSIQSGEHLNMKLGKSGKIKIERKLPFLLIHRNTDPKNKMVPRLITGESSFLLTTPDENHTGKLAKGIKTIGKKISREFGAVMIIEIWIGKPDSKTFRIKAAKIKAPATIDTLTKGLNDYCVRNKSLDVKVERTTDRHPPDMEPILTIEQCQEMGAFLIGLEIPPFFKDESEKEFYFMEFRQFKTAFSKIIRKALYEFIRVQTTFEISSFNMLGSTKINKLVWEIDQQLFDIQNNFQFLLLISPTNVNEALVKFTVNNYKGNPQFLYRLLPIDPDYLKEELFKIKIRDIEDPTLAFLFMDKREEIEKQVTMLKERGTVNFKFSSIRLYSAVDKQLYETASSLLNEVSPEEEYKGKFLDCREMADLCRKEIDYYRQFYHEMDARVYVKPDIIGMLVSKGQLYIGEKYRVPENRVEALIHHEVGTHVLTFYNGSAQPFKQLCIGLADYDELQEGIAVLAEYLVGGLTKGRLRLLAARVVAAHCLTEGFNFEETFHELTGRCGMDVENAFQITARIHQGGGCTKDIIYLRGLIKLLNYIKEGGEIEPLFIGKIDLKHVSLINELRARKILKPMPLFPRYFKTDEAKERFERIKKGIALKELVD